MGMKGASYPDDTGKEQAQPFNNGRKVDQCASFRHSYSTNALYRLEKPDQE